MPWPKCQFLISIPVASWQETQESCQSAVRRQKSFRVRTDLEKSWKMALILENSWNSKKVQFILKLSWNFEKNLLDNHKKFLKMIETVFWMPHTTKIHCNGNIGWLVGWLFWFSGPFRQYFSLYRAVSQREFDTRSGNILSFLLPLFQEGQLSVTGESMCTKYWLTA